MKKLMIFVAALSMVAAFALTAAAADWNFYGSARIITKIQDYDIPSADGDKDYSQGLHSNSRIGANVKVSDELAGRFEYGASSGHANIRLLYGDWNFGAGQLRVGQFYSPLNQFTGNSVWATDNTMAGMGALVSLRNKGVQFKFGNFKIAFLDVITDAADSGVTTYNTSFPKIEAAYALSFDNLTANIRGGYQTYEIDNAPTYEADINAYALGIDGKMDFGAFYVQASGFFGQNLGVYQKIVGGDGTNYQAVAMVWTNDSPVANQGEPEVAANGQVVDADLYGYTINAGWKLSDMFTFEAGYGYEVSELDKSGSFEDDVDIMYIQARITLAPGVMIVPEIGNIDWGHDVNNAAEKELTYYAVKWQIDF